MKTPAHNSSVSVVMKPELPWVKAGWVALGCSVPLMMAPRGEISDYFLWVGITLTCSAVFLAFAGFTGKRAGPSILLILACLITFALRLELERSLRSWGDTIDYKPTLHKRTLLDKW